MKFYMSVRELFVSFGTGEYEGGKGQCVRMGG